MLNRANDKAVYAMADTGFKANVTEEQLVNLLNTASTFGKIITAKLISTDTDNVSSYKLVLAKKSLQLNIRAVSASGFDNFGLSFYKLPIVRTRKQFLSDNPLRSHLDSVVQEAVTPYMSNKNVAGLSIGVLQNGEMYTYNFGETKKGSGQLPTANTIYEIGSVTKTFTGIMLANAVLEGKVKLDDDIRKYLDGNYPNLQFAGRPIALVNLSNHTSGLPSQPKIAGSDEDIFSPSTKFNDKMMSDILHQITLDTLPGNRRQYSNFAVGLLGIILEKAYGMNYEQLLKKYILGPYGMKQTKITMSKTDFKSFAQGYDVEGNPAPYWRNRIAEPDGGIRSTTNDMLMYAQEQMNTKDSVAWLSHQLTFGNATQGTGLNWGISTTKAGYLRWSHDGGTDGFSSLCLIYPELKSAIILLTNNGDHDDQSFWDIKNLIYNSWIK
jgi:CubicO group peptidase (beta-lactamase class C family)